MFFHRLLQDQKSLFAKVPKLDRLKKNAVLRNFCQSQIISSFNIISSLNNQHAVISIGPCERSRTIHIQRHLQLIILHQVYRKNSKFYFFFSEPFQSSQLELNSEQMLQRTLIKNLKTRKITPQKICCKNKCKTIKLFSQFY